MTAISKAFVTIADTAVDPDSPIDAALMTGLRDNDVHLREWIGASYTGGATQNHIHDGVGSAAIEIGPNWLRNGGFTNGSVGFTLTTYTGGTVAVGTSNETEGTAGLVITSTVAANGGGKAESNEFIPVVAGQTRQFMMTIKASVADVRIKAEVLWFNDAQASISNSTIVATTEGAAPTTDRLVVRRIAAPSTAKFCKIRMENPADATGTAGTAYFDGVIVTTPQMLGGMKVFTSNDTFGDAVDEPWGDVYVEVQGAGGTGGVGGAVSSDPYSGGDGGGGGQGGRSLGWVTNNGATTVTVGTSSAATSSFAAMGGTISATGGAAGTAGTNGQNSIGPGSPGAGGAGGVGSGGSINYKGSNGGPGVGAGITGGSGGGNHGAGAAGPAYGGGGGGNTGNNTAAAGSFAAGVVIVRW